jgi:hypothetical protein
MEDLEMRKVAVFVLTLAFVWSSIATAVRAEESSEKESGELAEALESVIFGRRTPRK